MKKGKIVLYIIVLVLLLGMLAIIIAGKFYVGGAEAEVVAKPAISSYAIQRPAGQEDYVIMNFGGDYVIVWLGEGQSFEVELYLVGIASTVFDRYNISIKIVSSYDLPMSYYPNQTTDSFIDKIENNTLDYDGIDKEELSETGYGIGQIGQLEDDGAIFAILEHGDTGYDVIFDSFYVGSSVAVTLPSRVSVTVPESFPSATLMTVSSEETISGADVYDILSASSEEPEPEEPDASYEDGYAAGLAAGIQQGRQQGYADGYDEGYEVGYVDGAADGAAEGAEFNYNEGYADGYADGEEAGYDEGYAAGEDVGYSQGQNVGYTQGYANGAADGYDLGKDQGYDLGYADGEEDGYAAGETAGYDTGYTAGEEHGHGVGFNEGAVFGVELLQYGPFRDAKLTSVALRFGDYVMSPSMVESLAVTLCPFGINFHEVARKASEIYESLSDPDGDDPMGFVVEFEVAPFTFYNGSMFLPLSSNFYGGIVLIDSAGNEYECQLSDVPDEYGFGFYEVRCSGYTSLTSPEEIVKMRIEFTGFSDYGNSPEIFYFGAAGDELHGFTMDLRCDLDIFRHYAAWVYCEEGYSAAVNSPSRPSTDPAELTGWSLLSSAFTSVFDALDVPVFGFFSLGDVIGVVLLFAVVFFVFKLFRG